MNSIDIIYEDNYLLAVNKPAGLMVEEDRFGNPCLISLAKEYLEAKSKREVFIANVHRLDRPTSGVLLFAKKKSALKNLNEQFQNRVVTKTYLAITTGAVIRKEGRLQHFLLKDNKNHKAIISETASKEAQRVVLEYVIRSEKENFLLWQINLLTGKYHQIRAQLAHIGCPVVGDKAYGSDSTFAENKICLHSSRLTIHHPADGKPLLLEATMPKEYPWALF